MNSTRNTDHRITWTTESLNFVLPLYEEIKKLRISKEDREATFVKGTLDDSAKITHVIVDRIGKLVARTNLNLLEIGTEHDDHTQEQEWDPAFWAPPTDAATIYKRNCPSVTLESAWNKVGDLFLQHSELWTATPEAFEVSSDDEPGEVDMDEFEF